MRRTASREESSRRRPHALLVVRLWHALVDQQKRDTAHHLHGQSTDRHAIRVRTSHQKNRDEFAKVFLADTYVPLPGLGLASKARSSSSAALKQPSCTSVRRPVLHDCASSSCHFWCQRERPRHSNQRSSLKSGGHICRVKHDSRLVSFLRRWT